MKMTPDNARNLRKMADAANAPKFLVHPDGTVEELSQLQRVVVELAEWMSPALRLFFFGVLRKAGDPGISDPEFKVLVRLLQERIQRRARRVPLPWQGADATRVLS